MPEELIKAEEYFEQTWDYALQTGFVRQEEKERFIKEYLKPIYNRSVELLEEVKPFLDEEETTETIDDVISNLNIVLEKTIRIGSAEPRHILNGIKDHIKFYCMREDSEYYSNYVTTELYKKVSKIISQF